MNILAIDYGSKNIGLAWVDTALGVVLPFGRMQNARLPELEAQADSGQADNRIHNELANLIKKEKVGKIVIGLPLGLDSKENENTKKVRKFVEELKKEINIPIEFIDERFTSAQADSMGGTVSRDEKSAMVILESYLDRISNPKPETLNKFKT